MSNRSLKSKSGNASHLVQVTNQYKSGSTLKQYKSCNTCHKVVQISQNIKILPDRYIYIVQVSQSGRTYTIYMQYIVYDKSCSTSLIAQVTKYMQYKSNSTLSKSDTCITSQIVQIQIRWYQSGCTNLVSQYMQVCKTYGSSQIVQIQIRYMY